MANGTTEWLIEKHGIKARRAWRQLHLEVDAETGRIVASVLTGKAINDGVMVGRLLDQPPSSITADGGYQQDGVYAMVAERHPAAAVIVPLRSTRC